MQLQLYYFDGCIYCQKVIRFIEQKNIPITYKNIHKEPDAYQELMRIGGKNQVPCLFIDGKPLYESNEIINWLRTN
ncbi:glutathione S-transferase N-terminal domain-containing protein [Dehalobacter sp. DCM]|uniref:glutaredoxin family protein n=1 Tax=Dehalobacter sp. DCM TaxID=2907827 RepID=UPI0030821884|nr:glutathione S-transferase N-terminal domain-containing protein [Dehalobacter sp. DCM]